MSCRHDMRRWTAEHEAKLSELWLDYSVSQIAKQLHRTYKAIEVKARKMNLPRTEYAERIYTKKTGRPRNKFSQPK